ncbi:unnamed protein product [Pseudo-nitzschia multistriata]|uniref:DUF819 domain-containing protein n=1 Tax=Pseudo-nitzschia multistriata TaxID=183589 RepID=A0A448ZN12_9STRA|nr:unnamed protein product [Pseudo-nitzschia multistriata]
MAAPIATKRHRRKRRFRPGAAGLAQTLVALVLLRNALSGGPGVVDAFAGPCSHLSLAKVRGSFHAAAPATTLANQPAVATATAAKAPVPASPTLLRSFSAAGGIGAAVKGLHSSTGFVLTAVLWLSTLGASLERRSKIGKALSAPLVTMALSLSAANLGAIPFRSPVYDFVNRLLVPLAVPLLLYDSDLRRVVRDTGTLLAAFCVGAFSTVLATLVAFPVVPLRSLGPDAGWRVACALAARHIGGAINFVAVAETLGIGGDAVAAAIAADNVVVALYFAFLFSIAKAGEEGETADPADSGGEGAAISELAVEDETAPSTITLPSLAISLSVASSLVTAGSFLTRALLPAGTSSLPLISALTVVAATSFPAFFSALSETGTALGVIFVQMFFACSGAAGSIKMVFEKAPALFAFSALQIGVHFATLVAVGRGIFRLPSRELYLASNANVGGPTTAAAMAQAKEWKKLVLPALLIGILGYATATALALSLGPILLRIVR